MARMLLFPYSNQLGSTIPAITLANLLKETHEVIFASGGKYTNILKKKGFKVVNINEISYKQYRKHVDNNNVDFYCKHLVRHLVDCEVELIKEIKPDIVVHNNRPTLKISSQITKKKLVSIVIPTLIRYYNFSFYIPDNHILNTITYGIDVNKILHSNIIKFVYNWTIKKWVDSFNYVLEDFKLSNVSDYIEVNEGDITLINQTYGLGKYKDLPNNFFFLEQNMDSTFGVSYEWLEAIKKAKLEGKKIIFISMGSSSFKSYPLVIKHVGDFVVKNSNKYILISNHCGLGYEYKDRKNIYIEKFINSSKIMPYIDLIITHGGINSLNEAIINKKLIIGIPEQAEQLWNLKYIEYLGLGRYISQNALKQDNSLLKKEIVNILLNKKIKKNINEFVKNNINKKDLIDHKKTIIKAINNLI